MRESKLDQILFSWPKKSVITVALLFRNINWKVVGSIDFSFLDCFVSNCDFLFPKNSLCSLMRVLFGFRCIQFNFKQISQLDLKIIHSCLNLEIVVQPLSVTLIYLPLPLCLFLFNVLVKSRFRALKQSTQLVSICKEGRLKFLLFPFVSQLLDICENFLVDAIHLNKFSLCLSFKLVKPFDSVQIQVFIYLNNVSVQIVKLSFECVFVEFFANALTYFSRLLQSDFIELNRELTYDG